MEVCPPGTVDCNLSPDGTLPTFVANLINAAIAVIGLVCVIMIVRGGIQYMQATGDPGKVKLAKETILYSVIGLVICALAFTIVNFVLGATK